MFLVKFLLNFLSLSFLIFPLMVASTFFFCFHENFCHPDQSSRCLRPLVADGGHMRLSFRTSTSSNWARVSPGPEVSEDGVFFLANYTVGGSDFDVSLSNFTFPLSLRNPGDHQSLWLHMNVFDADGNDVGLLSSTEMTRACTKQHTRGERFLMESSMEDIAATSEPLSGKCWRNLVTIYVLQTNSSYPPQRSLAPEFIPIYAHQMASRPMQAPQYLPVLHVDEEEVTRNELVPLSTNTSRPTPSFRLKVSSLTFGWYRMKKLLHVMTQHYRSVGFPEDLIDMILYELSPHRLRAFVVHTVASQLHSFFAVMAFKNDVAFFSQKQSTRGISLCSLMAVAVQSLITFLYLHDHGIVASYILWIQGIRTIMAFWMAYRVWSDRRRGKDEDKEQREEGIEDPTDQYDVIAIKYVGSVCAFLFIIYAVYALNNFRYRTFYSWFISSLAHASYTYGFVLMTPQLYVNYRLQSVAHLPWRSLTYKAFTTFVDDVSAWLIGDLPLAYKIACCRDDVVFLVLMYQRVRYRTDKTRVNEYGRSYEKKGERPSSFSFLPPSQQQRHLVKHGENLEMVAAMYLTTSAVILSINPNLRDMAWGEGVIVNVPLPKMEKNEEEEKKDK